MGDQLMMYTGAVRVSVTTRQRK